jgi:hypothetical protein
MQLRRLQYDVLIFWGMSFKVKEIYEMSFAQFNFFVANLANFVQRKKISDMLYRDDIDRAVHNKFEPENIDTFMAFLKSMPLSGDSHISEETARKTCN